MHSSQRFKATGQFKISERRHAFIIQGFKTLFLLVNLIVLPRDLCLTSSPRSCSAWLDRVVPFSKYCSGRPFEQQLLYCFGLGTLRGPLRFFPAQSPRRTLPGHHDGGGRFGSAPKGSIGVTFTASASAFRSSPPCR